MKKCDVGTEVQTLIFSKDNFTEKSAKDWAKSHDFKYGYVDEKENTYRIRQQEPSDFENMRTIEMTDGVKAVIGCPIDKYIYGGMIVSNDNYEFLETKHTKTGDTIYVLKIKKRLSPAEYKTVEANVKLIRGYYSGFVKGFVLKSKITKNEIERLFEGTSLDASELPKSEYNETLSGGKGDNKTIEEIAAMHNVTVEYAKEQLEKGIEIELEHTDDREKATEISKDHLTEFINYYIELKRMETKLEQEAEKTSDAPFKFEVGEYVMIIDEPVTNKENIYRVVGHQNYNKNYGWETTIKNLYTDLSVTMFENQLQISNKSEQIKEIIKELKESFSEIQQEDIDLHLKVRLEGIENEAELEKVKENYPIVIEWSEGNIPDNVGINNLDELNSKLIQAGFSSRPTEIYIKNKVLFRGYPHYIRIDVSKIKDDFDFENQHIRDWLKKYDSKFDWSVFDTKDTKQSEIEELEMLIELTQDSVNENPNDEELSLYLEMLKETLSELKNK